MKKAFLIFISLIILFSPLAFSQAKYDSDIGLVPKCGEITTQIGADGSEIGVVEDPCNFNYLMILVNNVIEFVLFYLATPLAAIIFAYAGFLYITSGGSTENTGKAKKIIKNVLIGYVIALAAFLIVKTIMLSLGFTEAGRFLDIGK